MSEIVSWHAQPTRIAVAVWQAIGHTRRFVAFPWDVILRDGGRAAILPNYGSEKSRAAVLFDRLEEKHLPRYNFGGPGK